MLHTPTSFPHAGSFALHQGEKVRIQQVNRNGDRLISGRTRDKHIITKTVPLAELEPFTEYKHNVERWADERIATVSFSVRTTAGTAYADYCDWYGRHQPDDAMVNRRAFAARLIHLGHKLDSLATEGGHVKAWSFTLNAGGVS